MSTRVHEAIYSGLEHAYRHSSTFEGHLLGMVAGLTVLDVIEHEGLLDRARQTGARLTRGLSEQPGVLGVRGEALLLAFHIEGLEEPDDPDGAATCMELLMERGVLVYPAAHDPTWLKLTPPLNLTEAGADRFLDALHDSLIELAAYRG
jgi:4-aminobutyrate aminotransferase-like enzyme